MKIRGQKHSRWRGGGKQRLVHGPQVLRFELRCQSRSFSKHHAVNTNNKSNFRSLSFSPPPPANKPWKQSTVLSHGVRSLFGPTRKSSPWGNFFRRRIKSINQAWIFIVNLSVHWLIDDKLTLTWLLYWTRTARSVFTGAGLQWPNTAGQYSKHSPLGKCGTQHSTPLLCNAKKRLQISSLSTLYWRTNHLL